MRPSPSPSSSLERILTWWIKDCDFCSSWLSLFGRLPVGTRENSDLMNKGLRLKDGVVIEVLLTPNERILTWWIKDCDKSKGYSSIIQFFTERILTWWIKDCDWRKVRVRFDHTPWENSDLMNKGLRQGVVVQHPPGHLLREFWLDE